MVPEHNLFKSCTVKQTCEFDEQKSLLLFYADTMTPKSLYNMEKLTYSLEFPAEHLELKQESLAVGVLCSSFGRTGLHYCFKLWESLMKQKK